MLPQVTMEQMNAITKGTMMEHLGIEFTEIGTDYLCAKMPVDHRTHQPMGLLHGGANAALAESLGSAGSSLVVDMGKEYVSGIEINANHIRAVREGYVHGKATILHRGKTTHVWSIEIRDDADKLVCVSRLTVMVIQRKQ